MSEPYDTDPRRSGASRARQPYDAAPDAYTDPSDRPGEESRGGRRRREEASAPAEHGAAAGHGDPGDDGTGGHDRAGTPGGDADDGGEGERAAAAKDYGRAGRNVPVSILVAVGLLLVILTPLFFFKPLFLVILVAAAGLGIWEMTRALRTSGARPPLIPLLGGGVAMMCLAWFSGVDALSIGLLITVLATMVWRMGDGPAGYQRDMGAAALTMVYVPFLLGFAAPLTTPEDGQWRILATLAAVVLSDTGGFVAGVLFGRHPMAPTISPKKSWEGFAGSILATGAGSAAILWALLDVAPWKGVLFGVVVSVAAVLGDLAESLLKRDLGIKDMSNILPGHGGIMDRLDSIVFAVPTAYLLLSVLAPSA
ncbi:phosphatidate cytidylyltransferase [Catellatospora paridis]|uniref:phosphatidate cytidylyltransferase n=1 Tax=Catellatospora paridis TaxID=1617086 RepID=UPI0018AFAAE6|nr:phosphatidate cytidylyltransferase [Catellatospora paridis]